MVCQVKARTQCTFSLPSQFITSGMRRQHGGQYAASFMAAPLIGQEIDLSRPLGYNLQDQEQ